MTELGDQLRALAVARRGRSTDEDEVATHLEEVAAEVDLAIIRADQVVPAAFTASMRDVIAERFRHQLQEGWNDQHDDEHKAGELASAASAYASHMAAFWYAWVDGREKDYRLKATPPGWPWGRQWWKPKDPRRDLVRAGALILAEIDRLDREATRKA